MNRLWYRIGLLVAAWVCGCQLCAEPLAAEDSLQRSTNQLVTSDTNRIHFLYDADFLFYFDNRECDKSPYHRSGTLAGVRLSPEFGVGYQNAFVGSHKLMVGVSYLQPFGAFWRDAHVLPIVYYQFDKKGFTLNFGMVPYRKMIQQMPDFLRYDSLDYYRPNIQGALFQYQSDKGFVELLCDWRGMCNYDVREAFHIYGNGQFRHRGFYTGALAQLNHLANVKLFNYHLSVNDDLLLNPYVGFDAATYTPFDKLSLELGYVFSCQRDRKSGFPYQRQYLVHAFQMEFNLQWKMLWLNNKTHVGGNLFPYYPKYETLFNQGDPYYRAKIYSCTTVGIRLFKFDFVQCDFAFMMHYTQGPYEVVARNVYAQINRSSVFSTQQKLMLRFSLDKLVRYASAREGMGQ